MAIVLLNAGATSEMRKEAREAVLLAQMDTALQDMAIEVDAWVSEALVAVDAPPANLREAQSAA